ncbi:hypothetical protein [Ralstonia phage RSF1]|uniref:Uncharacterized protein n=1 Tax=Ralstonia phage RSF1 TaxID=1689679 RepID=A0A0K2QQX6_9CAUD|nr:hypothetical protein AVU11_gp161 [Ralstonia phage RSF1]BAS04953.1 hypothetical protein [Ralstonia phage RSF1]
MAKTQIRKGFRPKQDGAVEYSAKTFEYSQDDSITMTLNNYFRLLAYRDGFANNGDRITLKIRILVGLELLKGFESVGVEEILAEAHDIVHKSWDSNNKLIRVLTREELDKIGMAVTIVHTLIEQSSLWEQASAYKKAEDRCIPNADKWEYVLITQD